MNYRTRALALSAFTLAGSAAYAQSTATLSGSVTDPSGAVLPQAQVTVHGLQTGVDRVVTSDSAGNYTVPSLQPGNYSVSVKASGFSDYKLASVTLQVDQSVTANVRMGVSSTGEKIEVQGAAPIIDAQTITVGQVIDRKTVQEIPLNGRHFLDLTNLTPGTVVPPVTGSLTGASRGLGANSFNTAGQREDSINFMINGINLNDLTQNQITFQPSINTTSEFKISNSTYSAEYGRSSGAIVNVATRSGTNQFHGEAFDYLRNNYFDARNYFNRKPQTQNQFIRNNFGGAFSGPVFKDRTFFFLSYEGLRQQQGLPLTSGVLDANQRATLAASTIPGYAGLLQFIPPPPAGVAAGGQATVTGVAPGPVKTDQFSGDLFHTLRAQDNIHAYYAWQQDARTEPNLQGNTIAGFGDHRTAHRQIGTVNEVHIFSSDLVNEARIGFNRIAIAFDPNTPENPASFGIPNGVAHNAALPQISISDISLNFGGPSGFPQGRFVTTGVFSDTLSWTRGKHTVRAGGEYRRAIVDSFSQTAGTLNFDTANNFALGLVNSASVTPTQVTSRIFANAVGAFVTDNYKVTPRFNAEIGFRYEWNGTPTEGGGRLVNFLAASDSLTPVSQPYTQNYNYEPRVGFIWDILGNEQTVLRGGYGIMADQPVTGVAGNLASNPPFATPTSFSAPTVAGAKQYAPVGTVFTDAGLSTLAPNAVNPLLTNAYTESYNLNLQQQLGAGTVLELNYVGSEGKHLRLTRDVNQFTYPRGITAAGVRPFPTLAGDSPERPNSTVGAINEIDSDSLSNYNALWFTVRKALQHGLQVNATYTWSKSQDENSLGSQGGASLQDNTNPRGDYALSDFDTRNHFVFSGTWNLPLHGSRFAEGWLLANITQLQTGNPLNVVTTSAFDGNSSTGTIRPSLLAAPTIGREATLATGNVPYITGPAGSPGVCTNATTPGCIFYAPAVGYGTLHRNAFTGPGFNDADISLEKTTRIAEATAFVLRVDAFDAFNHTNFSNPNLTATTSATSTFGQITATRTATGDAGSSRQLQFAARFEF